MKLPATVERVLAAVLDSEGEAPQTLRRAAADRAAAAAGVPRPAAMLPETVEPYVEKVVHTPWKVIDRDVHALREAGFSEDAIFELTVATALGSAAGRLEKALTMLDEAGDEP